MQVANCAETTPVTNAPHVSIRDLLDRIGAIKHYKGIRPRLTEEEDICQQSAQKDIETMMDIVSRLTIIKAEEEETKMLEMRKAMKKGHMRKERRRRKEKKEGEEGRRRRRKGG
ncbi:hypothetical protein ADUPG1_000599 [Aduncisulcus paluster]|uniref:Uncharacterized protein n=1 Tax=Aduncisulcus paluster TaxID=2918883 RepID=A0ABQ5K6Z6_9EUKA|nr:hypothetical protein ADUPG1_000599 [Aduncisulcus paluster]